MSFHTLLPVRDEADIISQSLRYMLTWADAIYVFDTGSVDETWEIVQDFATNDSRVVPLRKEAVYYSEPVLRGWMFHQARKRMRNGDWFLRVDADEFHHIPPPEFVQRHMRPHETSAWHQYYDFRLTWSEVEAWRAGKERLSDRSVPIEQRRKRFTPSRYSEPRLFRYRETMQWPASRSLPYNAGYVARERLPIRHYPHRDPEQLRRRVRLRAIMMSNCHDWTQPESHHWSETDWEKFVVRDDLPELYHWEPGTELPEFNFSTHLRPAHVRAVQRVVHALCLPLLDWRRPGWSEATYPARIPDQVIEKLHLELEGAACK